MTIILKKYPKLLEEPKRIPVSFEEEIKKIEDVDSSEGELEEDPNQPLLVAGNELKQAILDKNYEALITCLDENMSECFQSEDTSLTIQFLQIFSDSLVGPLFDLRTISQIRQEEFKNFQLSELPMVICEPDHIFEFSENQTVTYMGNLEYQDIRPFL